jgi:hypothetical protein
MAIMSYCVGTILCIIIFNGCKVRNENLNVQLSDGVLSESNIKGEIVYTGFSFQIQRLKINGVSYLVNSEGGIIKE